jgi:hypothetical protein
MEFRRGTANWVRVAILAGYWLAIFTGTHLPGRIVQGAVSNDKMAHFGALAGLAFLLAWVLAPFRPSRRVIVITFLVAVTYAAIDEVTQMLVPSRSADIHDWYADVAGAVIGIFAYMVSWVFASELCGNFFRSGSNPGFSAQDALNS